MPVDQMDYEQLRKQARQIYENGSTQSEIAVASKLSIATINTILSDSDHSPSPQTFKRLKNWAEGTGSQIEQADLWSFVSSKLRSNEEELDELSRLSDRYFCYKISSEGTHLLKTKIDISSMQGTTFRDEVLLPPAMDGDTQNRFNHNGVVFFRRSLLYFLSFEGSNIRQMVFKIRGHNFDLAEGVSIGRAGNDLPMSGRVLLRKFEPQMAEHISEFTPIDDPNYSNEVELLMKVTDVPMLTPWKLV